MSTEETEKLPPEPETSGTDKTQLTSSSSQFPLVVRGSAAGAISNYPLTDAIKEISEGGVRGQAGMMLLYASTQRLESDLLQMRHERNEASADAKKWKENYHNEKEKCAVQKEKLHNLSKTKILQQILITSGGIIAGFGASKITTSQSIWPIISLIFGLCLLLLGWISSLISEEETKQ